jgi:hypothetical protein
MHSDASFAVILWPLLVAIVGVLVYALASNPNVSEMGRIAYAVGLLWTVYDVATRVVHF